MRTWAQEPAHLAREQARLAGVRYYQGGPCRAGHAGLRYVCSGNCVVCALLQARARYARNKGITPDPERERVL